ncbi:MAG: PadR family transcriptional regulator [Ruminococcus sp.]|nr:PadR family transcriptional regulator [Ruminococcus sp.]
MDYIILGLLMLSNRTIYQLKSRIDKGLNIMYSSSMGSIQAAIKKLLANGYIDFCEIQENGKNKKEYYITELGKDEFQNWINSPIDSSGFKCPELSKLYFMGFTKKENRAENIAQYISELSNKHNSLNLICEEFELFKNSNDYESLSKEAKDIVFYQLSTARYGRDLISFTIRWYEDFLKEIR